MAKTTVMSLIELIVLKEDIDQVIEYLGKKGNFEFQSELGEVQTNVHNPAKDMFERLQNTRSRLCIKDISEYSENPSLPYQEDYIKAETIISSVDDLYRRESVAEDSRKRISDAYNEALAFSNLKVAYKELEHLSFLSLKIGKIDPKVIPDLQFTLGNRAVIVPLGDDKTRILAAASRKGRFALDTELKKFGFVGLEVPKDFKGIPNDMLEGLKKQLQESEANLKLIVEERKNYAEMHTELLYGLLERFSIGSQVQMLRDRLESTQLVYRLTGWIASSETKILMKDMDDLTEGRIAIREYEPQEVPSIQNGREKVPVQLKHGKLVGSFERLIFSYGAPLYGTIDPTPIVAVFFTLLFGIMFGDLGQGLVFILIGILLTTKKLKAFSSWFKFGPIFLAIGTGSSVMGLLTGEFFATEHLLAPFSHWVTGLFGEPREAILSLMPTTDSIGKLLMFFVFTLGVGFIINSVGLVINIINQFSLKRIGKALFGKTGLSGALFFWYVVVMIIRIFALKDSLHWFDWLAIGITLFGVFMAHPLERLVDGEKPIFENGIGTSLIEGFVEILEVVSSYLSNSVSFLRVGAFALAHAVLGFIIATLVSLTGGVFSPGGILVLIVGNLIVIVLEGMIVAIQVIRLQYYEFFSKFFTETGKEFIPFQFKYKEA